MGGRMDAVSFTKEWIQTEQAGEDTAKDCVTSHHRRKYKALSATEKNSSCTNPRITEIFEDQTTIEREDLFSRRYIQQIMTRMMTNYSYDKL